MYMASVADDSEETEWSHTLVIDMVRSTRQTLCITDVSVVYNFFGNIGGAYSLLALCFGLLYAVRSPEVETEFRLPGQRLLLWLFSYCCACGQFRWWPFRSHRTNKFEHMELPLTQSGPLYPPAPEPVIFSSADAFCLLHLLQQLDLELYLASAKTLHSGSMFWHDWSKL